MSKAKSKATYVVFKKADRQIQVTWHYQMWVRKNPDGVWDCAIPAFELFFNASSEEEYANKSKGLTYMFFDYYLASGANKLRSLSTQLTRLGFRSTNGLSDVAKFSRNKFTPTKFSAPKIEPTPDVEQIEMEGELVA